MLRNYVVKELGSSAVSTRRTTTKPRQIWEHSLKVSVKQWIVASTTGKADAALQPWQVNMSLENQIFLYSTYRHKHDVNIA